MLSGIRIYLLFQPEDLPGFSVCLVMGLIMVLGANSLHPMDLVICFIIGEEFIGDDSVCLVLRHILWTRSA